MKSVNFVPEPLTSAIAPDPIALAERLATIGTRVPAIDLRLLLVEQRLAELDQRLAATASPAPAQPLLARASAWLATLTARTHPRPLVHAVSATSAL